MYSTSIFFILHFTYFGGCVRTQRTPPGVVGVQVSYNLTLLFAVMTSFMFTHVLVFYAPFIHTATVEQREDNELSDAQVIIIIIIIIITIDIFKVA